MVNDFFLITLIFSILNLFLIIFFEKKYDLISIYDKPNIKLKNHKKRMPVYGGILFFINFIIFSILDILVFNVFFQAYKYNSSEQAGFHWAQQCDHLLGRRDRQVVHGQRLPG